MHQRCVEEPVCCEIIITYVYAIVESIQGICTGHEKMQVPPGVLAHRRWPIRRSYTDCILFLALPAVTIVGFGLFRYG
jgi:hypothetical protein